MVVFPLSELPELARGQGVTLQRYRDGGLSDAIAFALSEGLSWPLGGESGRVRTETRPVGVAGGAGCRRAHAADRFPAGQSLRLNLVGLRAVRVSATLINMRAKGRKIRGINPFSP